MFVLKVEFNCFEKQKKIVIFGVLIVIVHKPWVWDNAWQFALELGRTINTFGGRFFKLCSILQRKLVEKFF